MKEAKTEADKIIAAYRSEMEADYQASLAKVNKSNPLHFQQLYNRCIDRSIVFGSSLTAHCMSVRVGQQQERCNELTAGRVDREGYR